MSFPRICINTLYIMLVMWRKNAIFAPNYENRKETERRKRV